MKGLIAEKVNEIGSLEFLKKVERGNGPRQDHLMSLSATYDSRWPASEPTTHNILKEACDEITSKSGKLYGHFNDLRYNTKSRNAKGGRHL